MRAPAVHPSWFTACATLAAIACSDVPSSGPPQSLAGAQGALDEASAQGDGLTEMKVRAGDLNVWIGPLLEAVEINGDRGFLASGRASEPLVSIEFFGIEGPLGTGALLPDEKFQVILTEAEVAGLLAGAPLWTKVTPAATDAPSTYLQLHVGARYIEVGGTTDMIDIDPSIQAFAVFEELMHRTYLTFSGPLVQPSVVGPPQMVPALTQMSDTRWRLEYSTARLLEAASASEPVEVRAKRSEVDTVGISARLHLFVRDVAIGFEAPGIAWPQPACSEDVQSCLESLDACVADDTEICGSAWDVGRCRSQVSCVGSTGDAPPLGTDPYSGIEEHFPTDLSAYLEVFYASNADAIASDGGVQQDEALSSIDPGLVEEIMDSANDPANTNLELYFLVRHPDVVFPGSGSYWYGVYDRGTATLQDIYLL